MFFLQNHPLKALNTFGIDCHAGFFAQFKTTDQLLDILEYTMCHNWSWYPIGKGSNIIFKDDFNGFIIQCVADTIEHNDGLVVADAGVEWDKLVEWCVQRGLAGLENLSYIPGSVGASPVQNIGAYGCEAGDAIEWVEYFDTYQYKVYRIAGADCKFGYRDSIFKNELKNNAFIIRVAYRVSEKFDPTAAKLNYGDLKERVMAMGEVSIANIRRAVIEIRREKLPDPATEPNAGSFFKNPVVDAATAQKIKEQYPRITLYPTDGGVKVPAGALIDIAGWKGKRMGKVGVHPSQALVIVNYDNGEADDILGLAQAIQSDVKAKFGIELNMEVNVV